MLIELVPHQETMDEMIVENGIIESTSALLLNEDPEVREQAALLIGSFVYSKQARTEEDYYEDEDGNPVEGERQQPLQYTCECLQEKLDDECLKVRVASAWAFYKLSVNRDGCDIIVRTKSATAIINNFMKYCEKIEEENGKYLIYLLEALQNFSNYDNGIEPLLGKGTVDCLNAILVDSAEILKLGCYKNRIQGLVLRVLGNISLNHEGKNEAIEAKIILNAWKYLDGDYRFNASHVLMSCVIHLEGKKQAVSCVDDSDNPIIIQKMIERLYDQEENLRTNIKVALINIAEYPLGFDKIINELSDKIDLLNEVFQERGLKSLVALLPKIDEYDDPLQLDEETVKKYKNYVDSINKLFDKYEEQASAVAISETINFVEKLFPYLHPNLDTHEGTVSSLKEVCSEDNYSALSLKKMFTFYGDKFFSLTKENSRMTSINGFIAEKHADLIEITRNAKEIT